MFVIEFLETVGLSFASQMKEIFLGENSRLWWGWLLLTYPIIGACVGVYELKKTGQAITPKSVFNFVFPPKIYKSASLLNDFSIVLSLYILYAFVLLLFKGIESKAIVGKMMQFSRTDILDQVNLGGYRKSITAGIGVHLFFTFLVILAYDFGFTMLHYAFHRFPFLWRFHRVHHSAEHLTPLTVARFHLVEYVLIKIVEGFTLGLIFGLFYFLLPDAIDIYKVFGLSLFGILFSSIGVFRHSHIWISYGPLSYIFCSPAMHQIHHSKEERHLDKNLSQIFSFWDYMLGTLYIPKEREYFAVGLAGEEDWNFRHKRKSLGLHFKV